MTPAIQRFVRTTEFRRTAAASCRSALLVACFAIASDLAAANRVARGTGDPNVQALFSWGDAGEGGSTNGTSFWSSSLIAAGEPLVCAVFDSLDGIEKMIAGTETGISLAAVVATIAVLYLLNCSVPQIRNYMVKLITLSLAIFCGVVLEKIQLDCAGKVLLLPFLREALPFGGAAGAILAEFVMAIALFFLWFLAISVLCFAFRKSDVNMFGVHQLVAYEAAFVAIHALGPFQKSIATVSAETGEAGRPRCLAIAAYVVFPLVLHGLFCAMQFGTARLRACFDRQDSSIVEAEDTTVARYSVPEDCAISISSSSSREGDGYAFGQNWVHGASIGEMKAIALIESYLLWQALFFIVTNRIPSLEHDVRQSSSQDFLALGCCIGGMLLPFVLWHQVRRTLFIGNVAGSYEHNTHYEQMLACLTVAWCLLATAQWAVQASTSRVLLWTFAEAIAISLLSCTLLVIADRLVDKNLIGEFLGLSIITSGGLMVGFSWEMAFSGGVDVVVSSLVNPSSLCNGFGLSLIFVVVLPIWRYILLPASLTPVPEREHKREVSIKKAKALLDFAEAVATTQETDATAKAECQTVAKGGKKKKKKSSSSCTDVPVEATAVGTDLPSDGVSKEQDAVQTRR